MKLTMHLLKYFGLAILSCLLGMAIIGCEPDPAPSECISCDFAPYQQVIVIEPSGIGRPKTADEFGCVTYICRYRVQPVREF